MTGRTVCKWIGGAAIAIAFVFGSGCFANSSVSAQPLAGQRYRRDVHRIAFDNGYRTGLDRGGDDARSGRRPDPNRSQHYRDGDSGYHHEYGSIEAYRRAYRDGFRKGYYDAYRRYGRRRY